MKRIHSLLAGLGACIALAPTGASAQTKAVIGGTSVALTGKYAGTGQEQLNGFFTLIVPPPTSRADTRFTSTIRCSVNDP